jgi:hypothetical protein
MSSALGMVLMAAMAVPGNGPEKASGEVEQGLDLRGKWKGVWKSDKAEYEVNQLGEGWSWGSWSYQRLPKDAPCLILIPDIADEGESKLRLTWVGDPCVGIYKQDGDRLTICFCDARKSRPTSFRAGNGQELLILHRVKPGK